MNTLGEKQTILEAFFKQFSGRKPLLMLDYDGTLAPFHLNPSQALPYQGVMEKLQTLINRGYTEVAIVSGRDLGEIKTLTHLNPHPEIWGCHGWEWMTKEGIYHSHSLKESMQRGLEMALSIVEQSPFVKKAEVKPFCIALHWRGESTSTRQEMEAAIVPKWTEIAASQELELHPFSGGIELRPIGRNKGEVVKELLAQHRHPPAAYLGDDFTDEDAFRELKGKGLTILVREEWRPTEAELHLTPPEELLIFLDLWIEAERRAL